MMNSLSKIALFTLLSGAVFAALAADPHAGMAMHEQPAAAQAQSIRGKGVIKAIDMDNKKITIAHEGQRGLHLRSAGQSVAVTGYPRPITARRR